MSIESRYIQILKNDLKGSINLFTGAGFSVGATNILGDSLPLAHILKEKILSKFSSLPISDSMDLPMLTMMVSSEYPDEFRNFLEDTYRVEAYGKEYDNLRKLQIKYFFTTNIDNLPQKVFQSSTSKFLNNVYLNSINRAPHTVNFFPVHGNVEVPGSEYIFDTIQLADTGNDKNIGFTVLTNQLIENPIIFIGYSFNDLFAWRALKKIVDKNENNTNMWVLLRPEERDKSIFFEKLGFKTIIGGTIEFLKFLDEVELHRKNDNKENLLPQYSYKEIINSTPVRRVEDFYEGFEPTWNQIMQSSIKPLSILSEVENKIYLGKNIVVTGMIFSGKTTMAMQLLYRLFSKGLPAYFLKNPPTIEEANLIINAVKASESSQKPIIIIDDFCGTFEGVELLFNSHRVQVVGFDRFYNYDSLHHRVQKYLVDYIEITELSEIDASMIWDNIPNSIKNNKTKSSVIKNSATILEVIDNSLKRDEQVQTRVRKMLNFLEKFPELLELLVLAAYFQRAKSYLSMDVLIAYFQTTDYNAIFELVKKLQDQIVNVSEEVIFKKDQDYYVLRSTIYAYKILHQVNRNILGKVIFKVAENVPNNYIYRYDIFRKYAYDSELMKKAFYEVQEGLMFYDLVYEKEPNVYTYQHAAIYASDKSDFESAFKYIDRAMSMNKRPIFSIQNVYATILFKSNIGKNLRNLEVIEQLNKSMSILERCIVDSQGKAYHAIKYAEQAIEYFHKTTSAEAIKYIDNAESILEEQLKSLPIEQKKNIRDSERNLKRIRAIVR